MRIGSIIDGLGQTGNAAAWTDEAIAAAMASWRRRRDQCARDMDRIALKGSPFAGEKTATIRGAVGDKQLLEWAEGYDGKSGALLIGPTGVGKSAAASLALRGLIERHLSTWEQHHPPTHQTRYLWEAPRFLSLRWTSAVAIGAARRESQLGSRPTDLVRAEEPEVVVIDDLGWEQDAQTVIEVLAARYDAAKVTIATSGLGISALADRYGDSVVRRIFEGAGRKGRFVEAERSETE